MNADVSLKRMDDWNDRERRALQELALAVYPPEESATWPGRHVDWCCADLGIQVVRSDGVLVSYAGTLIRSGNHEGRPVQIGGVGSVKTHPAARRQGYAAMALRRAAQFFHEQSGVEFALLVCDAQLMNYYGCLGWKEFGGTMLTLQKGKTVQFTFNRVMVLDVQRPAPLTGTIDLLGLPW